MSRRSLINKQLCTVPGWVKCSKCTIHITLKDYDSHESTCPAEAATAASILTSSCYINNNIFYINKIEKKLPTEDTKDFVEKYLNSLIYLCENAMKLCEFYIGQYVVIENLKTNLTFVRLVWPIEDIKFPNIVYVSEKDFDENWIHATNHTQFSIQKLTRDPIPLDEIIVQHIDENDEFVINAETNLSDLSKLLLAQMRDMIFCLDNLVVLHFHNKQLQFKILDFKSRLLHLTDTDNDNKCLERKFQDLNIIEQHQKHKEYLLVTFATQITIKYKQLNSADDTSIINSNEIMQVTRSDIGGLNDILTILDENLNIALDIQGNNQIPLNLKKSRGILLYGPSGCGKTLICQAISNDYQQMAKIITINTSEIFCKYLGGSEKNLQEYFQLAFQVYPVPAIIIIEDIHNICPKQEQNQNDVIKRVSLAFLNHLDSLHWKQNATKIYVIGTTNSLDKLSTAIRRNGRLDQELEIPAPNPKSRQDILKKHFNKLHHRLDDITIQNIADITHGFVGSDLVSLIYKASNHALKQGSSEIRPEDINFALNFVKPSAMREVHIQCPNVKWEDIGGQTNLKLKLKQSIEWPLLHSKKFEQLGIKPPRGLLMFGPPGCSKTMIAKALATESQVNFLSIKGPELFSMWVGESERAVREVFRKARQVAPSIIFFDEIDAIGSERSAIGGNSSVKERVLTQMLTELDGVDALKNVTIIAATNRPDLCDKALLRPGRIDRIIYVGLPDPDARKEIFLIKLKKMPIDMNVNVDELVRRTEGYSGAEIQAVCHEAALKSLELNINAENVTWNHFESALLTVKPRTSTELLEIYKNYMKN